MNFSCISKHPILDRRFTDEGFVPAAPAVHQDAGYIGVKRTDTGKYRNVSDDGAVEDNRDSAGSGERFVEGVGSTVVAVRGGHIYVFAVA